MNYYNTIYVGMDVHKESFTLRYFTVDMEEPSTPLRINADYKLVLKYLDSLRNTFGDNSRIICGYEAGCLGYTLYHQLTAHNVECIILAPTTMSIDNRKKKNKNDKRDAGNIAKCLAFRTYSPVHIPSEQDEKIKEYLRMRDDHKIALKKIKQQILSLCLRHGYQYDSTKSHWTQTHIKWLRTLKVEDMYEEILSEYLATFDYLTDKIERLDQRIEELSLKEEYKDNVKKLSCFMGIKTITALSVIVEVGDFQRFCCAQCFASYLGLVPGEDSSGDTYRHLGITKAGNSHVRKLLIEAAQSYTRGVIGHKSTVVKKRQQGNSPAVISYADKANERLRRKYYKMVLTKGKKANVAKTAIARELACFIWGMMTNHII